MRVALVHDWLTGMRGGEKVLERLATLFPDAPIYTLFHHPHSTSELLESRDIRTSFLQRFPLQRAYRWYLPLFPAAVRQLDLRAYDLVISSSHCAVKAVRTRPGGLHLCYCHTPMRYAWDQFDSYFSPARVGRLRYAAIRPIMSWLQRWDRRTASRVDGFVANSAYVASRIRRYYDRDSTVIPPPVDTERFTPDDRPPDDFYLMVTALSPYKRVDDAVVAFSRMERRLVIVGWGPEHDRLRALAGPTIRFAGKVDDAKLLSLYRRCRGLVLPGLEDAGIAPLEAMACGRPALVADVGGAPENVIPDVTGVHLRGVGVDAIVEAVDRVEALSFNTVRIRAHAEGFSIAVFDRRIRDFVDAALAASRPRARQPTPGDQA